MSGGERDESRRQSHVRNLPVLFQDRVSSITGTAVPEPILINRPVSEFVVLTGEDPLDRLVISASSHLAPLNGSGLMCTLPSNAIVFVHVYRHYVFKRDSTKIGSMSLPDRKLCFGLVDWIDEICVDADFVTIYCDSSHFDDDYPVVELFVE